MMAAVAGLHFVELPWALAQRRSVDALAGTLKVAQLQHVARTVASNSRSRAPMPVPLILGRARGPV